MTEYVNEQGVAYYNNLINSLVSSGITPVVGLHHWDLPQKWQALGGDSVGGWKNPIDGEQSTADQFLAYARLCFSLFGDRVGWAPCVE